MRNLHGKEDAYVFREEIKKKILFTVSICDNGPDKCTDR